MLASASHELSHRGLERLSLGEVAERLKAHDWKSCVPQKGTEGSNPSLSANISGVGSRRFLEFMTDAQENLKL
jgi:hypothetical protein